MARVVAEMTFNFKQGAPIFVLKDDPAWMAQEMVSFPPRFLTDLQHIPPYSPRLTGFVVVRE
jgi:hypothetical protein